jgi:WD40 repeat protein
MLVSGASDGTLAAWRVQDRQRAWAAKPLAAPVLSVAFDRGGTRIAVGLEGGLVSEHEAASGALLRELPGHEGDVEALAFDLGGRLASGASDKTVRVWSQDDSEPLAVLVGHDQPVRAVAFAGGLVVSASEDATVRTADPLGAGGMAQWSGPDDYVSALAFSADGTRLLAGTAFMGSLALLDGTSAKLVQSYPGCDDLVRALAFQPDGQAFVYATEQDPALHRIALGDAGALDDITGHTLSVTSLAFDSSGTRLASGSKERAVRVFELPSGHELVQFARHTGVVQGVAYAPDGSRVASVDAAGGAYVWDARTAQLVATLAEPPTAEGGADSAALIAVAFAPDGRRVAIGGADRVARLFDAQTGALVREFLGHDHTVSALAFLGDERLVSGSYDGTVRVWDASSGRLLLVLRVDAEITAVAVAPDGTRIAASAFDNTVRVWNAAPPL